MNGMKITFENGKLNVPDNPIICFIEGDGIGPDIWNASQMVMDAAVAKAYGGKKQIAWREVLAGEKAFKKTGKWLPEETLKDLEKYLVGIKGPLTTPVGGGIRSLNVTMRQVLDLYACVRPVKYYDGTPSPVKCPELVDITVYRENTEDVYAGFEWQQGTDKVTKLIDFLNNEMGTKIRPDSGIGIKAYFHNRYKAPCPHGYGICNQDEEAGPDTCTQGQYHEVHRGRFQGLGLSDNKGRVLPILP